MASSNRHWPSMFKSKPCNSHHHHHHQWQHHDTINSSSLLSTTSCHRPNPFSTGPGCEERSPEPKPRWNPKPEQIRILEAIFNSGMVNPPRDEIRKIRAQLQEYGQVGDANVFYWFQNRKSRSKHKQRHLLQSSKQQQKITTTSPHTTTTTAVASASINAPPPSSSSSSSSDKSSPKNASNTNKAFFSVGSSNVVDLLNSPTASVNQTFYNDILPEPFFYPMQQQQSNNNNQGFNFSDLSNVVQQQNVGSGPGFLLSELMMNNHQGGVSKKVEDDDHEKMLKLHQQQMSYTLTTTINNTTCVSPPPPSTNVNVPLTINQIQGDQSGGVGTLGSAKSTVFINDVAFEVNVGPFNVRECFGDDAVLIHSSGHPVLTNEWGVTLQPLHHGAFYYLVLAELN